jgi:hypothetical protein
MPFPATGLLERRDMRARRIFGSLGLAAAAVLVFGPTPTWSQATAAVPTTSELAFHAADTDGSGTVDEAELAADQAKRFQRLDLDGDRALSASELDAHDAARFKTIDADGDGKLSFDEVMAAKLRDLGAADGDGDGDGRLSYDEVVRFEAKQR